MHDLDRGGGRLPYIKDRVFVVPFRGNKITVLLTLRMFGLKRSAVLSERAMARDHVLRKN